MSEVVTEKALSRADAAAWVSKVYDVPVRPSVIQYWEREGLLPLKRPGRRRLARYETNDLIQLQVLMEMRALGLRGPRLKRGFANAWVLIHERLCDEVQKFGKGSPTSPVVAGFNPDGEMWVVGTGIPRSQADKFQEDAERGTLNEKVYKAAWDRHEAPYLVNFLHHLKECPRALLIVLDFEFYVYRAYRTLKARAESDDPEKWMAASLEPDIRGTGHDRLMDSMVRYSEFLAKAAEKEQRKTKA